MNKKIWKALGIAVCMLALAAPRAMAARYEVGMDDEFIKFGDAVDKINKFGDKENEIVLMQDITLEGNYILTNSKKTTIKTTTIKGEGNYVLLNKEDSKAVIKKIVKTIKVKDSSKTVKKGKSFTVAMSKGLDKRNVAKISYISTDKSIATVNKKGKVVAKKKGRATIKVKVTLKNGTTKTVTMKVKVK